jgi:hypothetical protein
MRQTNQDDHRRHGWPARPPRCSRSTYKITAPTGKQKLKRSIYVRLNRTSSGIATQSGRSWIPAAIGQAERAALLDQVFEKVDSTLRTKVNSLISLISYPRIFMLCAQPGEPETRSPARAEAGGLLRLPRRNRDRGRVRGGARWPS